MFRAVPLPIIRSPALYIRYCSRSCKFQARSGWKFHLERAWKLSSNLHDI